MYEIVYRRSDREDDVVVTNADPRPEGHAMIRGERWEVVGTQLGWGKIEARFIVAPVPPKP